MSIARKTLIALGYARPGVPESPSLSREERAICTALNLSPRGFIARRDGAAIAVNSVSGGKSVQVIDGLHNEARDAGAFDPSATASSLAQEAAEMIAAFLNAPDADDAWKQLAGAGAYICEALERSAPPFSDRDDDAA